MAHKGWYAETTLVSEWDLSARQYRLAIIGTVDFQVVVASAANDGPILGVIGNKPQSGEAARVEVGFTKVQVAAAVTRGDILRAGGAHGFASVGNSGYVAGVALESATSGSMATAFIWPAMQSIA